ncbi:MAG TPA: hypothetical protein VIG99_17795 [Myxococcaceae bacterium]|jgi:hypothetical protein
MRLPLLGASMAVVVAGCTPPGFDRLGPFELAIAEAGLSQMRVTFLYDEAKQGCQMLDADFSAEMNGAAAVSVSPGKVSLRFPFEGECEPPLAIVPRPAVFGETATITATSGGDALLVEVEDLGATLGAHPILAPGEVVHAGQLVRLAIDPGFDRVRWGDTATLSVEQGSSVIWGIVPVAPPSAAGVLEVQLPDTMPPGPTNIAFWPQAHPVSTRCEGAGGCAFSPAVVEFKVVVDTVP